MLENIQVLGEPASGEARAVFDASAEQLLACSFAVSRYLRWRFGTEQLDVEEALRMRTLVGLSDQLAALVAAEAHGTVFLGGSAGALLRDAVSTYVTMRDLESHQSVEERARLAVLGELLVDLRDLCASLQDAAGRSDQPLVPA